MSSQLELLEIQDQEAVKNTYYRYPKVTPHIYKYADHIDIKTIDYTVSLHKIDEVVLYVIARFKYAPAWLIHQWFEVYKIEGYARIEAWIKVGIVWAETDASGVLIRPTYFLFELLDVKDKNGNIPAYSDVNINLVNHTAAEMQTVFDVMIGNPKSEIWHFIQKCDCLPPYHPLGIQPNPDSGVPIFIEEEFRSSTYNWDTCRENQDKLLASIRSGSKWTAEFTDTSLYVLFTEDDKGNKPWTQRPDLVIPMFRRPDGTPQSWSIEMELTAKSGQRYDKVMQSYKNNLVYGYVLYLCGNNTIVERVKNAYNEIGGLGTCKLFVAPWKAPAQRITDYSAKEEAAYRMLLNSTEYNTRISEDA